MSVCANIVGTSWMWNGKYSGKEEREQEKNGRAGGGTGLFGKKG